jgi:hypothetical protein
MSRRLIILYGVAGVLLTEAFYLLILFATFAALFKLSRELADASVAGAFRLALWVILLRIPLSLAWTFLWSGSRARELSRTGRTTRPKPLSGRWGRLTSDVANVAETALAGAVVFAIQSFTIIDALALICASSATVLIFGDLVVERRGRLPLAGGTDLP